MFPKRDDSTVFLERMHILISIVRFSVKQFRPFIRNLRPSHNCGELRSTHEGQKVRLCGWLQHKRLMFGVIRDSFGKTQFIFKTKSKAFLSCPLHSVIQVCGVVRHRPLSMINTAMLTGEIEVCVDEFSVLNACKSQVPFSPYTDTPNEYVRLKYRYLDLRSAHMQNMIRSRSEFLRRARNFLYENNFVEIETPLLCRQSVSGAHEFIVSSSMKNGHQCHYYLPQSPQIFKQLAIIGGFDRYFQIARCFRDEYPHPDRQPEFSQIDLEMSFVTEADIKSTIEDLIKSCLPSSVSFSFSEMTYADAVSSYGTDKPDVRYKLLIKGNEDNYYRVLNVNDASQIVLDFLANLDDHSIGYARNENGKKIVLKGDVSDEDFFRFTPCNSTAIFAKGSDALKKLSKLRVTLDKLSRNSKETRHDHLAFVWINAFPLFQRSEDGKLYSTHHPFTAPIGTLNEHSLGRHFDLVLNGQEIGGGSIRIHDKTIQEEVFHKYLKLDTTSLQYFLDALSMGTPPHGGIAIGLDRILAIINHCNSIRDVIAFPKSGSGIDVMTSSSS